MANMVDVCEMLIHRLTTMESMMRTSDKRAFHSALRSFHECEVCINGQEFIVEVHGDIGQRPAGVMVFFNYGEDYEYIRPFMYESGHKFERVARKMLQNDESKYDRFVSSLKTYHTWVYDETDGGPQEAPCMPLTAQDLLNATGDTREMHGLILDRYLRDEKICSGFSGSDFQRGFFFEYVFESLYDIITVELPKISEMFPCVLEPRYGHHVTRDNIPVIPVIHVVPIPGSEFYFSNRVLATIYPCIDDMPVLDIIKWTLTSSRKNPEDPEVMTMFIKAIKRLIQEGGTYILEKTHLEFLLERAQRSL